MDVTKLRYENWDEVIHYCRYSAMPVGRFVLDPPRYDIGTRMPKFVTDGRITKVNHIYDGDARQQFDAIWWYLQSLEE